MPTQASTVDIPEIIKLLTDTRKKLKIKQSNIAKLLRVSPNTVARWECGSIFPGKNNKRIIDIFLNQTNMWYFFCSPFIIYNYQLVEKKIDDKKKCLISSISISSIHNNHTKTNANLYTITLSEQLSFLEISTFGDFQAKISKSLSLPRKERISFNESELEQMKINIYVSFIDSFEEINRCNNQDNNKNKKINLFKKELLELCRKHKIIIDCKNHESIRIRNLEPGDENLVTSIKDDWL